MAPLVGDFSGNGEVDAADYVVARKQGSELDLQVWSSNYGNKSNWFNENVMDQAISDYGSLGYQDFILDMDDVLGILAVAKTDGITEVEFNDLVLIANQSDLFAGEWLNQLTKYTVTGTVANTNFQGSPLGNLHVGSSDEQVSKLMDKWFYGKDHPVAGGTYLEFVSPLFVDGPQYTDIHQGTVGDCYWMAGLAAQAEQNPQVIQDMFIVNGDGTYTVQFFRWDGTKEFVTVDSMLPTSNGKLIYAGIGLAWDDVTGELWAPLAEKAYAQLNEFGWSRAGFPSNGQNSYSGIDSGYAYAALTQISGNPSVAFSFPASVAGKNIFNEAYSSGKMICFITYNTPANPGVVGNHVYVVIGWDAESQELQLFNPWGIQYGILTRKWNDLPSDFMYFDYA